MLYYSEFFGSARTMPNTLVLVSLLTLQTVHVYCQNATASTSPVPHYRVLSFASNTFSLLQVLPDGTYRGFIWDLLNVLKDMMGFTFTLTLQPDGLYGGKDSYGNWIGMTGQLVANNADIVAGAYSVTSERQIVTDFTIPFQCYSLVLVTQPNVSLDNIKYVTLKGNAAASYLQGSIDPKVMAIWANIQANLPTSLAPTKEIGLGLARQGGWAFVAEDLAVTVALAESYGQLVITGPPLKMSGFYALGVQLGNKLGKTLSINMAKMIETGQMQVLLEKWGLAK